MDVTFKTSLIGELRDVLELVFNDDFKDAPGVKLPTLGKVLLLFPLYLLNQKRVRGEWETEWLEKKGAVEEFWKKAELKKLPLIVCHLRVFGPFGWFDSGKNHIYVRQDSYFGTLLHELVHLATQTPDMTYEEWEAKADTYSDLSEEIVGMRIS